jgi:DNA topoisomerase-1
LIDLHDRSKLEGIERMQAYCVKCKAKQRMEAPTPVFMTNGRPATRGKCPVCGTGLFKIGHTPAHADLEIEGNIYGLEGRVVIVESPAKARTVSRFLGEGYEVLASVGHIRDLPANRMGVDIKNHFTPRYVIPSKKKKIVRELRQVAKKAAEIYLATDPDREGEAIAWHLISALGSAAEHKPVHRVEFHEITQEAMDDAFAHLREIDMPRVDAQQARRILDRLVGYSLSPLLREKMHRKGLSAGRVQSVVLRLIVEREREITSFDPVEYWSLEAEFAQQSVENGSGSDRGSQSFLARLHRIQGEDVNLGNAEEIERILGELETAGYVVTQVRRGERRRRPSPPYTTSTLQQDAARRLGFTTRRTMSIAQQLYQGIEIEGEPIGLITYMRTDSVNVAEVAQAQAREFILQRYGDEFLPAEPPHYKTKTKGAQEAHEAIRPTSVLRTPKSIRQHLDRDQLRLYRVIWQRFVASQMNPAVYDTISVDIAALPEELTHRLTLDKDLSVLEKPTFLFRASGSQLKFSGFLAVYEGSQDEDARSSEDDRSLIPPLEEHEQLNLVQLLPQQHFTQPPPRYTEASLVRTLEQFGIGRPSTYAPTISTVQDRHFVMREGGRLYPTDVGIVVNDLLVGHFDDYINVDFTAEMEAQLDRVAGAEQDWVAMLESFYTPFSLTLEQARGEMPEVIMGNNPTGEMCEKCGEPLIFKYGRNGPFIGCSNYPDCRNTKPILKLTGAKCPECGSDLVEKRTRRGRLFFGCAAYDAADEQSCRFSLWKRPLPQPCPACGGLLVEAKKEQAQCQACNQDFPLDVLPPPPKTVDEENQPRPTIVWVPVK